MIDCASHVQRMTRLRKVPVCLTQLRMETVKAQPVLLWSDAAVTDERLEGAMNCDRARCAWRCPSGTGGVRLPQEERGITARVLLGMYRHIPAGARSCPNLL